MTVIGYEFQVHLLHKLWKNFPVTKAIKKWQISAVTDHGKSNLSFRWKFVNSFKKSKILQIILCVMINSFFFFYKKTESVWNYIMKILSVKYWQLSVQMSCGDFSFSRRLCIVRRIIILQGFTRPKFPISVSVSGFEFYYFEGRNETTVRLSIFLNTVTTDYN